MQTKKMHIKKHLSAPALLNLTRKTFDKIADPLQRSSPFSIADCLMSAVAMFGLKYSSLLQFDQDSRKDEVIRKNLQTLYAIEQVPCDTTMRERLDEVTPLFLQDTIDRVIAQLQRAKVLEQYRYIKDYVLIALDASGYFSSHEIHCSSCCERHHRDGTITYHHQMLAAVIVHPGYRTVFPIALEPILKEDGATKNDCEHNAAKRLLAQLHRRHPHLKMILLMDALYADGPTIQLAQSYDMRFIITAKEEDLKYLFDAYRAGRREIMERERDGHKLRYEFAHQLPLNDAQSETKVEFLEFHGKNGEYFCKVTDIPLTEEIVESVMIGGRARWKIENETFNTLKNQGYQFEHNFGHGYKHLSVILAYTMFIAFLIDQIQECSCKYFKAAMAHCKSRIRFWRKLLGLFLHYFLTSWEQVYEALLYGFRGHAVEILDSS